jgi:hypothetical protein
VAVPVAVAVMMEEGSKRVSVEREEKEVEDENEGENEDQGRWVRCFYWWRWWLTVEVPTAMGLTRRGMTRRAQGPI